MTKTRRFLWILSWFGLLVCSQIPTFILIIGNDFKLSSLLTSITVALFASIIVILFVFFSRKTKLLSSNLSWFKPTHLGTVILGELAIFLSSFIGSTVLYSFNHASNTVNQTYLNQMMSIDTLVPIGLTTVLVAPIVEEVLCRGIIPKKIFYGHEQLGYLAGWLVFTLLHTPTNIGSFIIYGGMSAILTYVSYSTKKLEMSILLHILHNGLTFILIIIAVFLQIPLS